MTAFSRRGTGTAPSTMRLRPYAAARARRRSGRCPDATSARRRSWQGRAALLLQLHQRHAAAALIVGCRPEVRNVGVLAQELGDRLPQLAGPIPVDDPQGLQ